MTSILHLHKTFQPPHLGDQPHPKCNEQQQQVELFILDQGPNTMLPAGSLAIRITSGWASVSTVAMASSSPCKNPGPGTDGEGQRQEYTKTLSHLHHAQHVGLKPGPCGGLVSLSVMESQSEELAPASLKQVFPTLPRSHHTFRASLPSTGVRAQGGKNTPPAAGRV